MNRNKKDKWGRHMKHSNKQFKTIRVGMYAIASVFLFLTMLAIASPAQAAPRQCVCHVPPKIPSVVCSAGFDEGHLNHGDPQGMCNGCGNGIRECCIIEVVGEGADAVEVAQECCSFEENPPDGVLRCADATEAFLAQCREEECDDGDNDCTTPVGAVQCDANCRLSNCDDGNECTTDTCDNNPQSNDFGACINEPVNEGESCDLDSECQADAVCIEGQCVGQPVECEDNDFCTLDLCDEFEGCQNIVLDEDNDGVADCVDNCPPVEFALQLSEEELEVLLDLFEADNVDDLIAALDEFETANPGQEDTDGNGIGDQCDEVLYVVSGDARSNGCAGSLTGFHPDRLPGSVVLLPYLLLGLAFLISGLSRLRLQRAEKKN